MTPVGEQELSTLLEVPANELYSYAVYTDADIDLCRQAEDRKNVKAGTGIYTHAHTYTCTHIHTHTHTHTHTYTHTHTMLFILM